MEVIMGIISDNLRKDRRLLRKIRKHMARSNSKAEVFDDDMYLDGVLESLQRARRKKK